MKQTPNYIKSLLMPTTKAPQGRRAWSIDLETVWLPFFMATNTMGDTAIPHDALGCPLRLAYNKDGSVKFSRNGRPTTRIAKPLSQSITLVRENFVANLQQYASAVATDKADAYGQMVALAVEAGKPVKDHEQADIDKAIKLQIEQAMKDAETKAEAETEAETEAEKSEAEREAVPA
jgi:hypothetical protein